MGSIQTISQLNIVGRGRAARKFTVKTVSGSWRTSLQALKSVRREGDRSPVCSKLIGAQTVPTGSVQRPSLAHGRTKTLVNKASERDFHSLINAKISLQDLQPVTLHK